jgi:lysophospholipase L1-like esterase
VSSRWICGLILVLWLAGSPVSATEPQWIWSPEMQPQTNPAETVYFRVTFQVETPQAGTIEIAADNKYSLWINGERIGAGDDWQQLDRYDIKARLVKGKNVLAVFAQNGDPPNPAGLVARVTIKDQGDKTVVASSSADWKTATKPQSMWWSPEFKDDHWKPAHVFGEFGKVGPWGDKPKVAPAPVAIVFQKKERPAGPFQLLNGDRVVFVGDTLIERAGANDYLETRFTSRYPDRQIKFRNLGWSGDTVSGESRAGFGSVTEGFQQLKQRVFEAQPTVIFVGYGGAASSAGEAGVHNFSTGLDHLLNLLEETKATIVILSPLKQEDLGKPLPNPAQFNHDRELYSQVLKNAAQSRAYPFVDLYSLLGDGKQSAARQAYTDNGVHLTSYGYWQAAATIEEALGWKAPAWSVEVDVRDQGLAAGGTKLDAIQIELNKLSFKALDQVLPPPPAPSHSPQAAIVPGSQRTLKITDLSPGTYVLKIDGRPVLKATSKEWGQGPSIPATAPEFVQAEKLRQAIIAKNQLFFYRWRPQNETYLFGFRKHEQGNNAREIPMFDPLIEKDEAEIAKLRVPVAHRYEVVRVGD